jgi:hypothetical protein
MLHFQDNFITNLTSGISSGATTAPINSVPSVDAEFQIALDATNINGHFEVVTVTSKTSTNVNFSACTYDHSTDEIIRMVTPASLINSFYTGITQSNLQIVPSVAGNNLTVALKTLAGNDPSASDPVRIRIGNTIHSITSALSITINAGTNWCNAGSAELATKEIDYFVYLGYNATDGVVLGFSRIPYGALYSDFSATTTNEKYCAISTITNATAGDTYVNIGRFAATLSAGAGYTWTVPTFTATNLVNRPIYESRFLEWAPTYTGDGAMTAVLAADDRNRRKYTIKNDMLWVEHAAILTFGGTANVGITNTLPFTIGTSANQGGRSTFTVGTISNVLGRGIGGDTGPSATVYLTKYDGSNMALGNFWSQWSGWANLR